MLLDLLVEAGVERVAPRLLCGVRQFDANRVRRSHGLCVIGDRTEIDADKLLDGLHHRQPRPAGRQIDLFAHPLQLIAAEIFLREGGVNALGDVHHVMEIGIRLIQLDGRELGVVLRVHALVAENTAYLIHAIHPADDQPLERQLGRDAHVHIDVERVVVRDERACRRAAGDGVQHRRLDLDIAHVVQIIPQMLDELRADDEVALDLGVDDQVDITLTIARLLVGQAVELLGQRQQGFAEQRDLLCADAHLAALCAENLAVDADDVADVVFLEAVIVLLVHLVLAGVELDAARLVLKIAEGDLAHAALGHHAPRDGNGLALHLVKVGLDFLGIGRADEFRQLEGVMPLGLKLRQLLAPHLDLIADGKLWRLVRVLWFLSHIVPSFSALDREHLVLQRADRGLDLDNVAHHMTEHRAAKRGIVRDAALHRVGFL